MKNLVLVEIVSVPSRGLCFQSPTNPVTPGVLRTTVSVPSRGLCFQSDNILYIIAGLVTFPSPLGDYVFNRKNLERKENSLGFPSPLGDYVFNLSAYSTLKDAFPRKFPSPLGDYVFNQ